MRPVHPVGPLRPSSSLGGEVQDSHVRVAPGHQRLKSYRSCVDSGLRRPARTCLGPRCWAAQMSQTTSHRWSFETRNPAPPTVVRTEPEREESGVARRTAVTVYFDQALGVGGQDLRFTLAGPDGEVPGYPEWVPGDTDPAGHGTGEGDQADTGWNSVGRYQGFRGVRFRPLQALQAGKVYEATLQGVENASGVPMAEAYTWTFETGHGAVVDAAVTEAVSYYFHGGQRVAMRQTGVGGEDVVYWLVGDHLQTTSLVLDEEGNKVAESRHCEASRSAAEWTTRMAASAGRATRYRRTCVSRAKSGKRPWDCITWGRGGTTLLLTAGSVQTPSCRTRLTRSR